MKCFDTYTSKNRACYLFLMFTLPILLSCWVSCSVCTERCFCFLLVCGCHAFCFVGFMFVLLLNQAYETLPDFPSVCRDIVLYWQSRANLMSTSWREWWCYLWVIHKIYVSLIHFSNMFCRNCCFNLFRVLV